MTILLLRHALIITNSDGDDDYDDDASTYFSVSENSKTVPLLSSSMFQDSNV